MVPQSHHEALGIHSDHWVIRGFRHHANEEECTYSHKPSTSDNTAQPHRTSICCWCGLSHTDTSWWGVKLYFCKLKGNHWKQNSSVCFSVVVSNCCSGGISKPRTGKGWTQSLAEFTGLWSFSKDHATGRIPELSSRICKPDFSFFPFFKKKTSQAS